MPIQLSLSEKEARSFGINNNIVLILLRNKKFGDGFGVVVIVFLVLSYVDGYICGIMANFQRSIAATSLQFYHLL